MPGGNMGNASMTVVVGEKGSEVVCRELTVGEVRALMASQPSGDLIDNALSEDIRLTDLPTFTNLKAEDIEGLTQSQLAEVVRGCKEANPLFFAMLYRVKQPLPKQ